ncbi:TetR/AcrR family transcriptional regulator [Actinoplanes sp. DH11]|uniref:TetR/AcrR family transcriptional regulator n=1 Tax=Actinoplanes sp. DH11 TaxID=2857011 RepID=UPI001E332A6D|nr:TetR/AcrR family transcriptional regulator [Actinoplanes sp. DH11]
MTPRRRGRPGHDQDAVLNAAVRLFNTRGYDATSMFDVAMSLGITKSTLYHHVISKEQLLTMAVDRALDGLFEAAAETAAQATTATARLEQLVRRSVLVLAERLEFVTLLLRVRGNTEAEQHALSRRREFDRLVADLVAQAQAEGGVRADVDPATAARLLFGMVNSLIEWYRPDRGDPAVLAGTVAALAFEGLRSDRTHPNG